MFGSDSDEDTAPRRAIQFCHNQARNTRNIAEYLHLVHGVLSRRRIQRLQHGMRRIRIELAEHPHDLFQLRHQFSLVLQTAGRIDDEHITFLRPRLLIGVVGKTGRIRTELGADKFRARAVRPYLQLLDRRGAERIASCQHHLETRAGKLASPALPG